MNYSVPVFNSPANHSRCFKSQLVVTIILLGLEHADVCPNFVLGECITRRNEVLEGIVRRLR